MQLTRCFLATLLVGATACSSDPVDPPTDAATVDGGALDSGPSDSGVSHDAGPPDSGVACGGHGSLHGDHCHCDEGYESPAADPLACVEVDPCDIAGNLDATEIPEHGSVAFVIVDGAYRFIQQPGMEDTSISYIDSRCERAYGWSRDLPFDDEAAVETSWVLDLATMTFTTLSIPDTNWVVLRNGLDDGRVVGKLSYTNGTADPGDDATRGFIHDVASGETELTVREGFSDIGFTGLNEEGVVIGQNDFGTQGFLYADGAFDDLDDAEAFRLFPFQINRGGTVVGFWGVSAETWWDNSVNAGFVATPSPEGLIVRRYDLDGQSGVGLTGLTDDGQLVGLAYATSSSLPVVFHAADAESAPTFFPLTGELEPFPTGVSERGVIHGQAFILEEPRPCGGHGTLEGDTCRCDEGFELDPHDMTNCVAPDAECSGHGHLHGDECHCDPGYRQDPADMMACIPS